jgi:hypothetical protein
MNERIKQLAEQAGYKPLPGFDFANSLEEVFIKKFAELIVRECAKRVESKADRWGNMTDEIINGCILECAKDLKEHFGVEE